MSSNDIEVNTNQSESSTSTKKHKRKHRSSNESNSDETSQSTSRKRTKKSKKEKKKLKKENKKKRKEDKIKRLKNVVTHEASENINFDIPVDLMSSSQALTPMTKEQWEKEQSVVRRVYDETTGRSRLIKGSGEVIEEIVSKDRHKLINQQATKSDGDFFQAKLVKKM